MIDWMTTMMSDDTLNDDDDGWGWSMMDRMMTRDDGLNNDGLNDDKKLQIEWWLIEWWRIDWWWIEWYRAMIDWMMMAKDDGFYDDSWRWWIER